MKSFKHLVLNDALVSAQEVNHGKPDPDLFLLAAERLGVEPTECIVIEDGKSGMIAAKKANMFSIGLVKDIKADYPADRLVTELNDISVEELKN